MKKQHCKFKIMVLVACSFILKTNNIIFAGENKVDPREMAVDFVIGGIKQGSHILAPKVDADINKTSKIPGSELSPQIHTGGPTSNVTGNKTGTGAHEQAHSNETSGGGIESGNTGMGGVPSIEGPETPSETPTTAPETIEGGGTDTSIITIDADVNLSEDNINADANLAIDPNAGGALVDADVTTSADIVNQELTSASGLLVDIGKNTTSVEIATIGTEAGTSTAAPVGETEAGIEADVEATGSGDVIADSADGLSSQLP